MQQRLYVATGADGVEHNPTGDVVWSLPRTDGASVEPGERVLSSESPLVLRTAEGLLEMLDERIFRAEALAVIDEQDNEVAAQAARLTSETAWDTERAARFALDCAAHSLEGSENEALPDGTQLVEVIAAARQALGNASPEGENKLGFLARLAALRRLRRLQGQVSDAVFATATADLGDDLDAVDDPSWSRLAACSEAVLAALEALRHVALPRYAKSREESVDEHPDGTVPAAVPIVTPWGAIAVGAGHQSPYEPAWAEARDAALRAREAASDRGGEQAVAAERAFQADLLEHLLSDDQPA